MTDTKQRAIKSLDNKDLLDIYSGYYLKAVREVILDGEESETFNALRAEILERMAK